MSPIYFSFITFLLPFLSACISCLHLEHPPPVGKLGSMKMTMNKLWCKSRAIKPGWSTFCLTDLESRVHVFTMLPGYFHKSMIPRHVPNRNSTGIYCLKMKSCIFFLCFLTPKSWKHRIMVANLRSFKT